MRTLILAFAVGLTLAASAQAAPVLPNTAGVGFGAAPPIIGHLVAIRGGGLGCVVRWNGRLCARPLGEDAEKAGDVFDDLSGVFAAQITPEPRRADGSGDCRRDKPRLISSLD